MTRAPRTIRLLLRLHRLTQRMPPGPDVPALRAWIADRQAVIDRLKSAVRNPLPPVEWVVSRVLLAAIAARDEAVGRRLRTRPRQAEPIVPPQAEPVPIVPQPPPQAPRARGRAARRERWLPMAQVLLDQGLPKAAVARAVGTSPVTLQAATWDGQLRMPPEPSC